MSQPDPSLRKVIKKKNGREMAEIMAVTNKAGYRNSIHPGWSLKFFVILTLILEMADVFAVTNRVGYRSF